MVNISLLGKSVFRVRFPTHRIRMYGIYANIWGILMVNVTIYCIHGSYGHVFMWEENTSCMYRESMVNLGEVDDRTKVDEPWWTNHDLWGFHTLRKLGTRATKLTNLAMCAWSWTRLSFLLWIGDEMDEPFSSQHSHSWDGWRQIPYMSIPKISINYPPFYSHSGSLVHKKRNSKWSLL